LLEKYPPINLAPIGNVEVHALIFSFIYHNQLQRLLAVMDDILLYVTVIMELIVSKKLKIQEADYDSIRFSSPS